MSDTPDEAPELGITMPTVVAIIDAARAAEELDEEATNEEMQDKETPEDDPSEMGEGLRGLIDDLNEEEQATLIALTWVGRGDYDASEWAEALRLARERNATGTAAKYLVEMEMLGDLLSEGLAAMGSPAEEVER
jgi:anthranilate phosphoribosyltransferase